jgi:mRNA interferase MazF
MELAVERFQVWLVNLDPTQGSEISKTRPCLVISPNETNRYLRTVTVAALTQGVKNYPTRVNCEFGGKAGQVALDQIRSIDKTRLVKPLGSMDEATCRKICRLLQALFEY